MKYIKLNHRRLNHFITKGFGLIMLLIFGGLVSWTVATKLGFIFI